MNQLSFAGGESRDRVRINYSIRNTKNKPKNKVFTNKDVINKLVKKLGNQILYDYAVVFGNTDHIQNMNIDILVRVIRFMYNNNDNIPNNFDKLVVDYIDNYNENDDITNIKIKSTFIRYINCYKYLKENYN